MAIKIKLWDREDETGEEEELELPSKFEVCSRCEGHGTHLTPSIGEHAYTREEFDEAFDDEESRAAYFQRGGMYDVTCHECAGKRVVEVVDEERCRSGELALVLARYLKQERQRAQDEADDRRTMFMESGGYGY